METLIKIGGLLAVLVVPIFLAHLNNRLAHLKHSKDSKAEALKLADEFESSELEKRSTLYKDRLAKSLFNNEALTYSEAKFFSKYENADLWVSEYVKVRNRLKRERDEDGILIEFKARAKWYTILLSLFGYIAFAFVGLIPFYKAQKYMDWILSFYDKGMLLSIFIIVALHTICLVAAFLCLKYVERCVDASIFINDFNKYAFKVHVIEEKENKDVDIVA
ncbi:hypothetical protein BEN74_01660 [Acinetobacter sp. WCHAc010034]|uniref:hypothetical protein n=1 Tax=Acinetobacter sp. WCHAc010034 TaxID=1879049 RepID=UPI00083B3816|nr:hypothetical protein [Acinetobacter sp. WCHAc010034]AYA04701.1 hypothetical protein BEN74_01660 [Acinetobacter sp. WCHAc010034]